MCFNEGLYAGKVCAWHFIVGLAENIVLEISHAVRMVSVVLAAQMKGSNSHLFLLLEKISISLHDS